MSDLFHQGIPDDYIRRVFDTMVKADWHIFQVLTKRSARLARLGPFATLARTHLGRSISRIRSLRLARESAEDSASKNQIHQRRARYLAL